MELMMSEKIDLVLSVLELLVLESPLEKSFDSERKEQITECLDYLESVMSYMDNDSLLQYGALLALGLTVDQGENTEGLFRNSRNFVSVELGNRAFM